MANDKDVKKVLLKAAKLIETKGWCKNTEVNAQGHFCAVGAINYAAGARDVVGDPNEYFFQNVPPVGMDARRVLVNFVPEYDIASWNDELSSKSGKRTVVRTLRRVAGSL